METNIISEEARDAVLSFEFFKVPGMVDFAMLKKVVENLELLLINIIFFHDVSYS